MKAFLLAFAFAQAFASSSRAWWADNGNGTSTNRPFYDEFSDPNLIRVGDEYYLARTYTSEGLDYGPECRIEDDAVTADAPSLTSSILLRHEHVGDNALLKDAPACAFVH